MTMRARVLAMLLLLPVGQAWAVDAFVFGFSPRTGDAFVDAQLGEMNVLVRGDTAGFIDDVVVRFGAPRTLVHTYVVERRWAPADLYYGCAIAQFLRRPCVEVLRVYERDHRLGWGVVAQRLGIRPGSAAFHALKGNVGRGHARYKSNRGAGHGNRGNGADGRGHGSDGRGHKDDDRRGGPPPRNDDRGNGRGNDRGIDRGNGGREH
jgi:hypothetical protein